MVISSACGYLLLYSTLFFLFLQHRICSFSVHSFGTPLKIVFAKPV